MGGGQEKGMRAGTENIIGILGFGEAASILESMSEHSYEKVKFLLTAARFFLYTTIS